jgi:predicted DCC family thiol-disulfide oxidoreductase YuxK
MATLPVKTVLCYDANCHFCVAMVRRLLPWLRRWDVRPRALQAEDIAQRLGLEPGTVGDECRLIATDGRISGGGDVVAGLAEAAGWQVAARILRVRPFRLLLRRAYRLMATRWHCQNGVCALRPRWWQAQTFAMKLFAAQTEHRRHGWF